MISMSTTMRSMLTCSAWKPQAKSVVNSSKSGASTPPITSTISAVSLKGAVSMEKEPPGAMPRMKP